MALKEVPIVIESALRILVQHSRGMVGCIYGVNEEIGQKQCVFMLVKAIGASI